MVLIGGLLAIGCERTPAPPTRSDGVASLSPAMTTILIDLGAEDRLVGRTPWCRGIDDRPVVGALDGVDAERIARLQPAVVVVQPSATGVDPGVLALQERLSFTLVTHRLDGAGDVIAAIDALEAAGVGEASRAAAHRDALGMLAESAALPRPEGSPRILVLHAVDPFAAAGAGTYLDEVVRAAGGVNALPRTGWCTLGAEEVVGLDPDVVLLVTGGIADIGTLEQLPWSRSITVRTLDADDALEPSTRMPTVVAEVRRLIGEDGS